LVKSVQREAQASAKDAAKERGSAEEEKEAIQAKYRQVNNK
jgi:hypothetical protein